MQRGFARSLITAAASDGKLVPASDGAVRAGLGADLGSGRGRCLCRGEWNSAVYGPLAEEVRVGDEGGGDVWCDKNRMSGLWSENQPLWRELTDRGKRTLLFAGVNTDQCVLGTLTDAYNAGWDCVLLEDCCATTSPGAREVCLYNVAVSAYFHNLPWIYRRREDMEEMLTGGRVRMGLSVTARRLRMGRWSRGNVAVGKVQSQPISPSLVR